jgi:hypothetical protein
MAVVIACPPGGITGMNITGRKSWLKQWMSLRDSRVEEANGRCGQRGRLDSGQELIDQLLLLQRAKLHYRLWRFARSAHLGEGVKNVRRCTQLLGRAEDEYHCTLGKLKAPAVDFYPESRRKVNQLLDRVITIALKPYLPPHRCVRFRERF